MPIYENTSFEVGTVFVLVCDELLLLRRSEWKKIPGEEYRPHLSHTPDFPGGGVGDDIPDESPERGATRELKEETGIATKPENLKLVFTKTYFLHDLNRSKNHLFYLLKLNEKPEIKLSWEHEEFYWIPLGEVKETLRAKNETLQKGKAEALDYLLEHRDIFGV